MAHFAEINTNSREYPEGNVIPADNKVMRVCVVDNANVPSDKHIDGETWCTNMWGGTWKQTSYNGNFRKQFAAVGDIYDAAKDKFIKPQPYASWTLDGDDDWQAPIAEPADFDGIDKKYSWNETAYQADNSQGWEEV